MILTKRFTAGLCALAFCGLAAGPINADPVTTVNLGNLSGPVTQTGALPNQAQVLEDDFTVTSTSSFTAFTTSYGGGMNLNGTTQAAGGFQPSLILFNSAGNYVKGENLRHTGDGGAPGNPNLNVWDAVLTDSRLTAGSYILVLTDWENQQSPTATNLSDGFTFNLGSGGSTFVDSQFNTRTANYALNISASPVASAVPEPATFWVVVPLLGGALMYARRRRASLIAR
jgi:hypothetical protein